MGEWLPGSEPAPRGMRTPAGRGIRLSADTLALCVGRSGTNAIEKQEGQLRLMTQGRSSRSCPSCFSVHRASTGALPKVCRKSMRRPAGWGFMPRERLRGRAGSSRQCLPPAASAAQRDIAALGVKCLPPVASAAQRDIAALGGSARCLRQRGIRMKYSLL